MQRMKRWKEKFHRRSRRSKALLIGSSCLMILSVFIMIFLNEIESQANGYVLVDTGAFWSDIVIPKNLQIWQKFNTTPTVTSNGAYQTKSYNTNYNGNYTKTVLNVNYARDNQFSLNVTDQKLVSSSQALGDDLRSIDNTKTWTDNSGTSNCKFSWISGYASGYKVTYYRVVEEGEIGKTNWGAGLFEKYSSYDPVTSYGIRKNKDSMAMVTDKDSLGRDFKAIADEYLKTKNHFQEYTNNTKIPMTKNGKPIVGVEMITVTIRDFYYDAVKNGASRRVDLDLMVYTCHDYEFNYGSSKPITLSAPNVTTGSGNSIATGISSDDCIILEDPNAQNTAKMQYYLSDTAVPETSSVSWRDYQGPIAPGGKRYIYVRSNYKDGMKPYMESGRVEHEIHYMESSSAFVKATPENGESIDVGKEIILSQSGAVNENAAIFYVIDREIPSLTKISYSEQQRLQLEQNSGGGKYAKVGSNVYIKVNGIWYQSSDDTLAQFSDPIITGEDLRLKNTVVIYALVEDSGRELGQFQKIQYNYNSSEQTQTPQSTVTTSAAKPTVVKMGSSIELLCNTSGSKIFYTLDGTAPVIELDSEGKPMAGNGSTTKEYKDSEPIIVSEEVANYGKSFLVMAQAVTYKEIGGTYYRICQDSPVAKFIYTVADQTPVESVKSIPQTNADKLAEVQIGSMIQLYSPTDGVDIYYTLDGTEPDFDENGTPKGTTKKYSGSTGIKVEKSENSSLFTITAVANKQGLAVSDISRLVFSYPGAVTSPYANPASGAVAENTQVTLKSATEGAIVYYEIAYGTDTPNDPTTASKVFDAANPIVITKKTTIKAYAVKNSMESTVSTFTYTVSDKLKTPTPSIDTGAVVASGTVISLSADSGATIYYTLDGSDPKDASNKKVQVGSNVIINGQSGTMIMLRTYAAKQGFTSSDSGTYSYSVSAYTGGIYADRESGSIVKNGDTVYLHTDMTDAKVYYTVDGSAPTENSHSGNSVTIHGNPGEQFTIMAMAVAEGSEKSTSFATFTYTIMNKLAAPTSSIPDGAIFIKESVVELKAETGRIYYTTDGTDPTTSSNLYKKSITIDKEMTIKAMAVADDLEQSDISTFHYGYADQVAAPIASYASGELEMGTKVTFTCATEGATIYYRTDGKEINLSEKNELEIYKEPITINKATNFKVIAIKDKMQDSKVLTVGYTVKEPVVSEIQEAETQQIYEDQGNRLQSRRSFSDTESGPSYTDVVLRNASYGAVIAAEEGILPESVQLRVESTNVTDAVNRRVQQVISDSYGVVASYDVTLLVNGEETQPDGTIEIGLPIPVEYENAMLHIVHVLEDGNIELYETRRSGGIAYAKVDHLSVYSIAAPVEFEEEKTQFPWLPVVYSLAVGMTGLGCFLIYKAKKEKREDGMQDD